MFNHLAEFLRFPDGRVVQIGGEEPSQPEEASSNGSYLTEFRLENQLPVWRYEVDGIVLEKHLLLPATGRTRSTSPSGSCPTTTLSGWSCGHLFTFAGTNIRSSEGLQDDYVLSMQGQPFEYSQPANRCPCYALPCAATTPISPTRQGQT